MHNTILDISTIDLHTLISILIMCFCRIDNADCELRIECVDVLSAVLSVVPVMNGRVNVPRAETFFSPRAN